MKRLSEVLDGLEWSRILESHGRVVRCLDCGGKTRYRQERGKRLRDEACPACGGRLRTMGYKPRNSKIPASLKAPAGKT